MNCPILSCKDKKEYTQKTLEKHFLEFHTKQQLAETLAEAHRQLIRTLEDSGYCGQG